MKQKFISCFTALLVGATLVPACGSYSDVSVVRAYDLNKSENVDGYDYELWNQNDAGSVDMQLGSNGAFSCSWSGVENCLFHTGKKLGSTKKYQDYGGITINYDVDYQPMGNSYLCVYGWTEHPLVEYYIVEAWGSWRPPGQTESLGTVTSDGKQYDIYRSTPYSQPSIYGTETYSQYWSVQKTNPAENNVMKNIKGTVTVSNHFDQWEKAGLTMGKMYEVTLSVEGYRSDGKADVKKNELIIEKENINPSTGTDDNPSAPVQNSGYLKDAFADFFKVGTTGDSSYELDRNSDFFKNQFNSITPENELKPRQILDQYACQQYGNNINTQVSFRDGTQSILQFCSDNGIPIRGKAFVLSSNETPDWFFKENFQDSGEYVSEEIMDKRLESFIKNTFDAITKQYPSLKLYAYDVSDTLLVNYGDQLTPVPIGIVNWHRVYNDDSFIEKAFTYARKYAPSCCRLYLSDDNAYVSPTINDTYTMAMKLKAKGLIDGIGMESHLDGTIHSISVFETAMKKYISAGLDVQVTSLVFTSAPQSAQARLYKDIFRICVENTPHVSSLTVYSRDAYYFPEGPDIPSLFDPEHQETEEFKSVMEYAKALENTTPVTTSLPVTTPVVTSYPVTAATTPVTTVPVTATPFSSDLKGDVDCSGSVTAADIVKMMQVMIGNVTLSSQGQNNADLNKDGVLSIVDLILLKSSLI